MADVRLTSGEEEGDLPAVCMCCGDRASHWVRRTFIMQPPVVHGPSGFQEIYALRLLIATAQAPRMRLRTSFCSQHRNYWTLRSFFLWGGLAGLLAILFGGIALIVFLLAVVKFDAPWLAAIVMVPLLLYFLVWIPTLVVVQRSTIRAQYATDGTEDVVLHNVHPKYVEALQQQRGSSGSPRPSAAGSTLPEALPAGNTDGPTLVCRAPSNSAEEAAAYQSIADQLAKGTTPRSVEESLTSSGWKADTAQLFVARVLEEMPGVLRSRYAWQLYTGLALCALAGLGSFGLTIGLLITRGGSKTLWKFWVIALLWLIGQVHWLAISGWRMWLAHRLEKDRTAWLRASGVPVGRAASMPSASTPSSVVDDNSALARRAIEARDSQRLAKLRLIVGGSMAGVLVLGCCCGVPLMGILNRIAQSHDSRNDAGSPSAAQQSDDPNAPDSNEGPPPRGWTVLFRSDDPAVWNTDSPGKNFALPVRRAHSKIRYLRLTRLDTHEMLIVPITREQLTREERPASLPGYWWNGSARQEWGARHLGIVQVPSSGRGETGLIGVTNDSGSAYCGSGFGWKLRVDDKQYYCWQGQEIPRTTFEIAVTADPLTEAEKRRFTGPESDDGPSPHGWTILFRSNDPADWNTFRTGERFAVPVGRAHAALRYLRLKRMDTEEVLIIPITRKQLAAEPNPPPEKGFHWCGTAKLEYGGRHLGILQAPRERWPQVTRGRIVVMNPGWDGYFGSGFGHARGVDKDQRYSWKGQEIPQTVFEIAVKAGPLSEDEKQLLLE